MKVIIRLLIIDDDRAKLAKSLGHSGLVTRKQVSEAVADFITEKINGNQTGDVPVSAGPERKQRNDIYPTTFSPSRGDEEYMYCPQDPELAAICSTVLDTTEKLDRYIWKKLEENRQ